MSEWDEQLELLEDTVIGAALLRKMRAVLALVDEASDRDAQFVLVAQLVNALEAP